MPWNNFVIFLARLRRSAILLIPITISLVVLGLGQTFGRAAPAADCSSGNLPTTIDTNMTLSGDLFATGSVTVRNNAALTLTEGTHVTMCGEYDLRIEAGSRLMATGTSASPVVFDSNDPATHWGRIHYVGSPVLTSTLRHLTLKDGGGSDPAADLGALHISASSGSQGTNPVIDHLTVQNSGAYGAWIRYDGGDSTPLSLTNLTITGSTRAPLMIYASAVGGLGTGNTFSGNTEDVIEVRAGTVLGGRLFHSQTWKSQPVPYKLVSDAGDLTISGNNNPLLTIEPGTSFLIEPDMDIRIAEGRLLAKGTASEPIFFGSSDPAANWGRLHFEGINPVLTSTLRHVTLKDGGGNDPLAEQGALHIAASAGSQGANPVVDHLAVENSGAYGAWIRYDGGDSTPLSLTNLTITGSTRAPLMIYASAVGGLGTGNTFSGNTEDVIEVRAGTVLGGSLSHSQTWKKQPIPYKLGPDFATLTISSDNNPILTIEPGNTILMGEGMGIKVNRGGIIAAGTEIQPITFTRVSDTSALWDSILLEASVVPETRFSHVNLLFAGSSAGAIDVKDSDLSLSLDHVTIRYNQNGAGIRSWNPFTEIKDSAIEFNQMGAHFEFGAGGVLRRNSIQNNAQGGVIVTNNSGDACVDAIGNYWGHPSGPVDSIGEVDTCNLSSTNGGAGDAVSADVFYSPWLTGDEGDLADRSSISPAEFWVTADGVQTTTITVTVRSDQGVPLEGRQVALQSTRGVIQQPTEPTDANGITTAVISSTETGEAIITANNLTDDAPLSAQAAVFFWQGGGESAGLIDPSGVPYLSPQLILEGLPFQLGLPVQFRVPMQNSNSVTVGVVVTYSVSGLNIGGHFAPVDVVSQSLQPGESWDAPGEWIATATGHHCVRATMAVTFPDQAGSRTIQETVDVGPFQVNFDVPDDPCKETDPYDLIPRSGGLKGVAKHIKAGLVQSYLVNECLNQNLSFGSQRVLAPKPNAPGDHRDYHVIFTPPSYTPPALTAGDGVTQAQAEAATAIAETSSELGGLNLALMATSQRIRWAGQAGDQDAAALQVNAYIDYQQQYAQKLTELADRIDDLLAITEGAGEPDTSFSPQDYQIYLQNLKTAGYDAETIDFHKTSGLLDDQIEVMLEAEIARLEGQSGFTTTSFYEIMRVIRDSVLNQANEINSQYSDATNRLTSLTASAPLDVFVDETSIDFTVGNPTSITDTVDLNVVPVDVPIDWTYRLDRTAISLGPGETTTVTLSLDSNGSMLEETTIRIAVQGSINGEHIGGILFTRSMPRLVAPANTIYLPTLIK